MKKNAPHLPLKICLTDANHLWHDFMLIIYSILIAIATATAVSLILFNYFYPTDFGINSVYVNSNRTINGAAALSLDAAVVRDWRGQIMQVFDESKIIQPAGIYPDSSFVGKGVVLNSGGWSALYAPAWISDKARKLIGIDYLGSRFPVEKYILDKDNGIVYLKFKGDFRGTTVFADWRDIGQGKQVWTVNGEWIAGAVSEIIDSSKAVLPAARAMNRYSVLGYASQEGLAVDSRGGFVGFVGANGAIIPSWLIEHNIISILNTGGLDRKTVDWRGYFVNGIRDGANWKEVRGFYIFDSAEKAGATRIGKGDVLLKINGEAITRASLARLIALSSEKFTVTALRGGVEVQLTAVKMKGK